MAELTPFYIRYRCRIDNRRHLYKSWIVAGGSPLLLTRWEYVLDFAENSDHRARRLSTFITNRQRIAPENQTIEAMIVERPPYEWLIAQSEQLENEVIKLKELNEFYKSEAMRARLSQE